MEADTLFAIDPTFYGSPANYYYYGVSDEIGYWDKSRRFWTDRDFPKAHTLCHLIKARLASLDLAAPPAAAVKEKLEAKATRGRRYFKRRREPIPSCRSIHERPQAIDQRHAGHLDFV